MTSHHRSLEDIQADIAAAKWHFESCQEGLRTATADFEKAKTRYLQVIDEERAHPTRVQEREQEEETYLLDCFGPFLYEEIVVKEGLQSIKVRAWRVETRHSNQYNWCRGIDLQFKDKKKCVKYEYGDWGCQGYSFNALSAKREAGLTSVPDAWAACLKANKGGADRTGAIFALVQLALNWGGILGVIDDEGSSDSDEDSDEQHRSADYTGRMLDDLVKVLDANSKKRKLD
jgi:hypothetical protein